jgi:hypothetical protein
MRMYPPPHVTCRYPPPHVSSSEACLNAHVAQRRKPVCVCVCVCVKIHTKIHTHLCVYMAQRRRPLWMRRMVSVVPRFISQLSVGARPPLNCCSVCVYIRVRESVYRDTRVSVHTHTRVRIVCVKRHMCVQRHTCVYTRARAQQCTCVHVCMGVGCERGGRRVRMSLFVFIS